MSALGRTLLALGFLAGAFVAVRHDDHVAWAAYLACLACLLAGVVLVRKGASSQDMRERAMESVATLERCLESLCSKLARMRSALETGGEQAVFQVHGSIDSQLTDDLASFVEHREGLSLRYGLLTYADVMSAFALAERLVNRAWSASADGYLDEVRRSLAMAEREMTAAREKLAAAARA